MRFLSYVQIKAKEEHGRQSSLCSLSIKGTILLWCEAPPVNVHII